MPQRAFGGNISIAYSGKRDNTPVDTAGNTAKTTFIVFYHIHDGSKNDTQYHNTKHKNQNFSFTAGQGFDQRVGLSNKTGEFKDSKYPQQSKSSKGQKGLGANKKQREVFGNRREKIDNAIGAKDVFGGFVDGQYPQYVFYCKDYSDKPFGNIELVMVFFTNRINAFQCDQSHTGKDKNQ